MKILLDPVYSSYPSRCSSAAKCWRLIEKYLIEQGRDDVFFYWLYPEWVRETPEWEREQAWLPNHPNVTLVPLPYNKDRMREYAKFTSEMDDVYAFNGRFWDIDGVFTSRTSMIPLMRANMTCPRTKKHGRHLKTIVDFEEMIMMHFRPTVPLSDVEAQEILTCAGYLSADKVMLMTEAEKAQVMAVVRQYLSPAMTRKVNEKIALASQVMFKLEELKLKAEEFRFKKGQRQFCLGFTGRLESAAANLDTTWNVFDKQFCWRGMDMKMVITTVSVAGVKAPPDFVDVRHPNREEFWKAVREEMDLVMALHNNVEFSLAIVEPMLLGTPVLLHDQRWSRDIFGDDYPFYVGGMTDVYAWVREFYLNYDKWYAVWAKYHQEKLVPMFSPGGKYGTLMYDVIYDHYEQFMQHQKEYVLANFAQKAEGIPAQIQEFVKDREKFNLFDVIEEMGCFPILQSKTRDGDRDRRRITFSTDWTEMRMLFKYFWGWKDGVNVGDFVR